MQHRHPGVAMHAPRSFAPSSFLAVAALAFAGCEVSSSFRSHDHDHDHDRPPGNGSGSGSNSDSLARLAQFDNVAVGVAASRTGRTFLSFSRAIDEREPYSLAEIVDDRPV